MNKVIAAYIYMRHYQRLQQQEDSSFIRNMITCYATMTRFYAHRFIDELPETTSLSNLKTVQDIRNIARYTLNDMRSATPTGCLHIDALMTVTDDEATRLYHSIPEMKQLHPGLEKLLPVAEVKP